MSDQHIEVEPDAIRDGTTGNPIITKEQAERIREEWTAQHPPIPGLRWVISFNMHGEPVDRRLEAIPGWEDTFAPPLAMAPRHARHRARSVPAAEANRLGALAYHGWFHALPEVVRRSDTTWGDLADEFREPLRQAAIIVWQHAENAGFHEALLRTLPAGQLGAAGELENMADQLLADHGDGDAPVKLYEVLAHIRSRVAALRDDAQAGARRVQRRDR